MPAKLKGLRRATRLNYGNREIKMLGPVCRICQAGDSVPVRWWETCTHEPYVGTRTASVSQRKYEDVLDDEGNPTGEKIVVATETTTTERPWPNFRQVTLSTRVNSGRGVEKARAKGFILPEELRCDAYPDGIAPCCQFRGCFYQDDLKEYRTGTFCRPEEAAIVYEDQTGKTVEVADNRLRQDQLNEALSRVSV